MIFNFSSQLMMSPWGCERKNLKYFHTIVLRGRLNWRYFNIHTEWRYFAIIKFMMKLSPAHHHTGDEFSHDLFLLCHMFDVDFLFMSTINIRRQLLRIKTLRVSFLDLQWDLQVEFWTKKPMWFHSRVPPRCLWVTLEISIWMLKSLSYFSVGICCWKNK